MTAICRLAAILAADVAEGDEYLTLAGTGS